ncbi:unnamed protein product [Leptidea sinapis]|uniref:Uncharacterized protein n=1 Tax=Leptidea sinapis TaxID=189913 RepID=A0A5E4Q6H5_9NEOP|nr:unnamed protein product [Leptidea sinapis]
MSSTARKRYESLLFQYETTNKTDFRYGAIKEYPKTVYKPRASHSVRGRPLYKHIHTMAEWKGARPSFDLMITPKEIVRTNPKVVQKPFSKPIDEEREEVQKSRPRLVMTPAVSMDDIDDPQARNILCGDMYKSQMRREYVPLNVASQDIKAPLPGLPAPANPITLPKLQPPLVSPEWRMESVSWDQKQLRTYSDHTRDFWLGQKVPRCRACEETAIIDKHRKMIKQVKK